MKMLKYGENKEIAMRMAEEDRRMARKYPWYKLLWWWATNRKRFRDAVHARLWGEEREWDMYEN